MKIEFENSIRRLSILCHLPDIKTAWRNPCTPDVRLKSRKTIACFVSRKSCYKTFENKKKLANLNDKKHNCNKNIYQWISLKMNEPITFNCRSLKCKELIHSCYSRNGVINIRMTDKNRLVKIFHMERLINLFSNFDFDAGEMYLDALQNADASVHSTYFKCSSVEWVISGLGVLMMHEGTFKQLTLCENMLLLSYFNAFN